MLYFLVWLLITVIHAADFIKFKYLIFLTHWGFLAWNCYLVLAALTATAAYCRENHLASSREKRPHEDCGRLSASSSDCEQLVHSGRRRSSQTASPTPSLACKLHWVLFLIGGEYAVVITALYWVFYHGSAQSQHNLYSLDSLNIHMINGIFAAVDLWISGVPVRLCHAIYSIAFGCCYFLFTILYYVAGGTNPEGERFIYPFLDYASNPRAAVALAICCSVFGVGFVHCLFFFHYVLRKAITANLYQSHFKEECRSPKEAFSEPI